MLLSRASLTVQAQDSVRLQIEDNCKRRSSDKRNEYRKKIALTETCPTLLSYLHNSHWTVPFNIQATTDPFPHGKTRPWVTLSSSLKPILECLFLPKKMKKEKRNQNETTLRISTSLLIRQLEIKSAGEAHLPEIGVRGCATRWAGIFTAGLTMMGLHFQSTY